MTKKQFLDFSLEEKVNAWNKFSVENNWNEFFYENDEFTFKDLYLDNPYQLAYHIHYGNYDYNDTYIYYDDLGHLVSFSDELTLRGIIDIDEMLKWYNENKKEI